MSLEKKINKKSEKFLAREYVSKIETILKSPFLDNTSAVRMLTKLLESKKIQSIFDQIGDKHINRWVNKKYPYTELDDFNSRVNSLLKSNFYLNKVYSKLNFPIPPYKFINEKVRRYGKREASLLEWIIGYISMSSSKYEIQVVDKVLSEIIYADIVSDEKELEKCLAEFEKYQQDRIEEQN